MLRRLTRFASEDIGLADPQALVQCLAAKDAYDFLGSPEGELAIVQACLYLATAPKSNAAYVAQKSAWRSAKETGSLMPPAHILNAPTQLMKDIGYGKGYAYDHDADEGFSGAGLLARGNGAADLLRADRPRLRGQGRASGSPIGTRCGRSGATTANSGGSTMYQTDAPAAYWRDQLIEWGPRVVFAILILVVTHFVAKAVQWGVAKLIDRMPVLKRHPAGRRRIGRDRARPPGLLAGVAGRADRRAPAARPVGRADPGHQR